MPIPAPRKDEKQTDFISRCAGDATMNKDYPDDAQRVAVCYSAWEKKHGKRMLISVADFDGEQRQDPPRLWRAAPLGGPVEMAGTTRCIRYCFSTSEIGRDGHRIAADAWLTDNYMRNPVFLWAHMTDEPPIGRTLEIGTTGDRLMGTVQYAETDMGETCYQLVRGGFLNATSTGWMPLAWKYSNDRRREGGIDFSQVELLEVSQVPVPALPTALAEARSRGINTSPVYEWAEKLLDRGDSILIPRTELARLRRAAMPTSSRKAETQPAPIPAEDPVPPAPTEDPPLQVDVSRETRDAFLAQIRCLQHVSWLANLVGELSWLQESVEYEAEIEGDNSDIPRRLLAILKSLGQTLVDMTAEEVAELVAEPENPAEDATEMSVGVRLVKALAARMNPPAPPPRTVMEGVYRAVMESSAGKAWPADVLTADQASVLVRQLCRHFEAPESVAERIEAEVSAVSISDEAARIMAKALYRVGRVMSGENERTLRDALGMIMNGAGMIQGVCDAAAPTDPVPEIEPPPEPIGMSEGSADSVVEFEDSATRERRAKLRQVRDRYQR